MIMNGELSQGIFDVTNLSEPMYLSQLWLGYALDDRVQFPAGVMMGFFLFATASRPDLGPTKPSIQWVK
jgi:hypothetical protein